MGVGEPCGEAAQFHGDPRRRTMATAVHRVPLLPRASGAGVQGFVRGINRSAEAGEVSIAACDDAGVEDGPVPFRIEEGNETVRFTAGDLEAGNPEKGLEGETGPAGEGPWRLELERTLALEVLSYVRTRGVGGLASLRDVVPRTEAGEHRVVFFHPASNRAQVSLLRLINPGEAAAEVSITGLDAEGEPPGGPVTFSVPGAAARTLSAQELESGEGEGLAGALGDGAGK